LAKSEQIGELHELEIGEVNEKLRTIQRLIDGLIETFGEDFLTQFMTIPEHNTLGHELGVVVPHDSILNLLDVSIQNDTFEDNQNQVLKIKDDATVVEALSDPDVIDINNYIAGTEDEIIVTDDGDNTVTLSAPYIHGRAYYFGHI
jgi:hypothetical protein